MVEIEPKPLIIHQKNAIGENSFAGLFYTLFKYSLLLLFLQSMFAWFLWDKMVSILLFAVFATILFSLSNMYAISFKSSDLITVLLIVIIEFYIVKDGNGPSLIAATFRIVILSTLVLLNNDIGTDLFQFFTKAFAIILSFSIAGWILHLVGFILPHNSISFNSEQYNFDNYYFFLFNQGFVDSVIPRFTSVFLEPGQLGMITSFFLVANRFNLRNKYVIIIFIGTLITFSLVAYILLFISLTAYFTISSKNPVRNIILWSMVVFVLYFFFRNYNGGDNVFSNYILLRLEIENGELSGNNRFSADLIYHFQQFMNSEDRYFGIGAERYGQLQQNWEGGSAGYKVFILQYGIVGLVIVFFLYLFLVLKTPSKMAFILFFVYILCFVQAAYPLWECELLLFITALSSFKLTQAKSAISDFEEN